MSDDYTFHIEEIEGGWKVDVTHPEFNGFVHQGGASTLRHALVQAADAIASAKDPNYVPPGRGMLVSVVETHNPPEPGDWVVVFQNPAVGEVRSGFFSHEDAFQRVEHYERKYGQFDGYVRAEIIPPTEDDDE